MGRSKRVKIVEDLPAGDGLSVQYQEQSDSDGPAFSERTYIPLAANTTLPSASSSRKRQAAVLDSPPPDDTLNFDEQMLENESQETPADSGYKRKVFDSVF